MKRSDGRHTRITRLVERERRLADKLVRVRAELRLFEPYLVTYRDFPRTVVCGWCSHIVSPSVGYCPCSPPVTPRPLRRHPLRTRLRGSRR